MDNHSSFRVKPACTNWLHHKTFLNSAALVNGSPRVEKCIKNEIDDTKKVFSLQLNH